MYICISYLSSHPAQAQAGDEWETLELVPNLPSVIAEISSQCEFSRVGVGHGGVRGVYCSTIHVYAIDVNPRRGPVGRFRGSTRSDPKSQGKESSSEETTLEKDIPFITRDEAARGGTEHALWRTHNSQSTSHTLGGAGKGNSICRRCQAGLGHDTTMAAGKAEAY